MADTNSDIHSSPAPIRSIGRDQLSIDAWLNQRENLISKSKCMPEFHPQIIELLESFSSPNQR